MASAWVLTAPLIADGALPSRPWAALAAWEISDLVGLSCSPANFTLIVWSWLQKSAAELPPPPPQALIVAAVPAAASRSVALRQFRMMMVIMMGDPIASPLRPRPRLAGGAVDPACARPDFGGRGRAAPSSAPRVGRTALCSGPG